MIAFLYRTMLLSDAESNAYLRSDIQVQTGYNILQDILYINKGKY